MKILLMILATVMLLAFPVLELEAADAYDHGYQEIGPECYEYIGGAGGSLSIFNVCVNYMCNNLLALPGDHDFDDCWSGVYAWQYGF